MSVEVSSSPISEYHQTIQDYIRKRKRMESELHGGPSEIVKNLVKNIKLDEIVAEAAESKSKKFSSDMTDACKTICQVCKMPVTLNYMRNHTKNFHGISINDYKNKFGNHRDQIVEEVYHKCGICCEEMLLDADNIHLHVKRHKISLKDYNAKYITGSKTSPKRKLLKNKNKSLKNDNVLENLKNEAFSIIDYGGLDIIEEIDNLFDTL